jgi:hypothetical protein
MAFLCAAIAIIIISKTRTQLITIPCTDIAITINIMVSDSVWYWQHWLNVVKGNLHYPSGND